MNKKMQIFDRQGNRLYLDDEEQEGPQLAELGRSWS